MNSFWILFTFISTLSSSCFNFPLIRLLLLACSLGRGRWQCSQIEHEERGWSVCGPHRWMRPCDCTGNYFVAHQHWQAVKSPRCKFQCAIQFTLLIDFCNFTIPNRYLSLNSSKMSFDSSGSLEHLLKSCQGRKGHQATTPFQRRIVRDPNRMHRAIQMAQHFARVRKTLRKILLMKLNSKLVFASGKFYLQTCIDALENQQLSIRIHRMNGEKSNELSSRELSSIFLVRLLITRSCC